MIGSYKTIEEVWAWRKRAYGKIDKLPDVNRIDKINRVGEKYAKSLGLKVHKIAEKEKQTA